MSKKKQGGKTAQHVRPTGKRLGVKVTQGQKVSAGNTLIRQRGTNFHAGHGVETGRDHTLFATKNGLVTFSQKLGKRIVSILGS